MSIEQLKNALDNINSDLAEVKDRIAACKERKDALSYEIADTKGARDREYEAAKLCRSEKNWVWADDHKYKAQGFNESLSRLYEYSKAVSDELRPLYDRKNELQERKNQLREQLQAEFDAIKQERERRNAMWAECSCKICGRSIRYNKQWNRIPTICKECSEKEKAKWQEKSCRLCGSQIRYRIDWNRVPNLCKECTEREKAKWQEKSCRLCGTKIRYRIDWNRVPDLCKECTEREKAKWQTKHCAKCGKQIRYNVEWTHIPNVCNACKDHSK